MTKTPTAEAGMTTETEFDKGMAFGWKSASGLIQTHRDMQEKATARAVAAEAALAASTALRAPAAVPEELRRLSKAATTYAEAHAAANAASRAYHASWDAQAAAGFHSRDMDLKDVGEKSTAARNAESSAATALMKAARTLAAAPAAPPADGGTSGLRERIRQLEAALAEANFSNKQMSDAYWKSPAGDDALREVGASEDEIAALSARTTAGAAGDPVGAFATALRKLETISEGKANFPQEYAKHALLEIERIHDGRLPFFDDRSRPASSAPTPSPESTLSPAQVATIGYVNLYREEDGEITIGQTDLYESAMDAAEGSAAEFSDHLGVYAVVKADAALARYQSPAVDLPAERERIGQTLVREFWHTTKIPLAEFDAAVDRAVTAILDTRPTDPGGARGETLETIAQWCEETFGPIQHERIVSRAAEEMDELRAEPSRVEEAADVVIVLARYPGLWTEIQRKMEINRKRRWRLMGDGTGYHIKEPPAASTASSDASNQLRAEADRDFDEDLMPGGFN